MSAGFVLDASVAMSWCFEDETSRISEHALDLLAADVALVPSVWPLEVANVLLVAERRKRLRPADSERFLDLLQTLPIRVQAESAGEVFGEIAALARSTGLSSYDASYLRLAMTSGLPLATLDKGVRRVARKLGAQLLAT
ncbi:MAG: type II toxin-antitoxin system VapC family toxin [Deltaproteobacteria bacterium]|jgi:predicted nucleic acid-binding protein|nr:type II toxin-antitoxin system VapC family toxin [Deltaproteobacteria bacterium]